MDDPLGTSRIHPDNPLQLAKMDPALGITFKAGRNQLPKVPVLDHDVHRTVRPGFPRPPKHLQNDSLRGMDQVDVLNLVGF